MHSPHECEGALARQTRSAVDQLIFSLISQIHACFALEITLKGQVQEEVGTRLKVASSLHS